MPLMQLPKLGRETFRPVVSPAFVAFLSRLRPFAPNERGRLFALTIVIGGVCGLAAVAFHAAIGVATAALLDRAVAAPGWIWMVLTPTCGALAAGILLEYVAPNARGSGIPQVKLVYALRNGRLRLRDAVAKFMIATLQLGTGSSLGREGPTVQICASLSAALGRLFAISPKNTRRLVPVGAAAGIAAAFNAPIAAVTFTIEEVVGDLDQTLLSGVVVAAAVAAVVEHGVLGEHPVFSVPGSYRLAHSSSLLTYVALGIAAAALSRAFYALLLRLRLILGRKRGWAHALMPGVGGLVAGCLALIAELALGTGGVLGDGYATLSAALAGSLSLKVMAALVVLKLLATVTCYSSGGAGGIFAPVLFIGAMVGGVFGHVDHLVLRHAPVDYGSFALVGMGAFFAAVIRAPITSVLIIFEMTRGYGLILPLMIANSVAYVLARGWQPVPIYEALLEQDGIEVPHTQRAATALSAFRVSDAMTTELITLRNDESIADALRRIEHRGFSMYPVVDARGLLRGVVTEARLRRHMADGMATARVDSASREEAYLHGDSALVDAVAEMSARGARQMAVIDPRSRILVGVLAMSDMLRAHTRAAQGELTVALGPEPEARPALQLQRRDASQAFRHSERGSDDIPLP